jgi:hypothetical protein
MARRKHHHVYVIELSRDVLLEPRFRRCNPGYVEGKPCVCVGIDLRSAGFGVWQA